LPPRRQLRAPPKGLCMPLPTFVIAGAQKCGTSTLVAPLRRHPEVHMARPKEVHFFDRKLDRGLEWYAHQFTPRARQRQFGESSPTYLYDERACEAMCRMLPQAKIVVILRDPVQRAYSHFWHSRRLGFDKVERFEDALALEPERLAGGTHIDRMRFSYVDRGHYVEQLTRLEAAAGRDRLHVMLLDDLATDWTTACEGLFGFLGVAPEFASSIKRRWTNKYRVREQPGGEARVVAYPPLPAETRARLVEHFWPWNDRLAAWLGRDLSAWNKF
jgi:Sulfotransferase domain